MRPKYHLVAADLVLVVSLKHALYTLHQVFHCYKGKPIKITCARLARSFRLLDYAVTSSRILLQTLQNITFKLQAILLVDGSSKLLQTKLQLIQWHSGVRASEEDVLVKSWVLRSRGLGRVGLTLGLEPRAGND